MRIEKLKTNHCLFNITMLKKCNLFTHEAPRSSRNSFKDAFKVELEFVNVAFCGGRKTGALGEKPSEQGVKNQQQTQPTYDAESRNRTLPTLQGGECSHHCAIPALFKLPK